MNGDPLSGDTESFAFVILLRCAGVGINCFEVSAQSADGKGRFQFSLDFSGVPLEVGTYQIVAVGNNIKKAGALSLKLRRVTPRHRRSPAATVSCSIFQYGAL